MTHMPLVTTASAPWVQWPPPPDQHALVGRSVRVIEDGSHGFPVGTVARIAAYDDYSHHIWCAATTREDLSDHTVKPGVYAVLHVRFGRQFEVLSEVLPRT